MDELWELLIKQRNEINKYDLSIIKQIVQAYGTIYQQIAPYIRNVELYIQVHEGISIAELKNTMEYVSLLRFINKEIADFATYARVELDTASMGAVQMAIDHINTFFFHLGIRPELVTADAAKVLLKYLEPGGELSKRMELWAPNAVEQVSKSLLDGLALGRNPHVIASDMKKALGVGLTDALRTSRTATMYAYRESTRLNYIANSDIVKGWIWLAQLDSDRTCMSCRVMHGTIHPLTEPLNDHYNGRCTTLPLLDGIDYGLEDGEKNFNRLSEAMQKLLMGKGKLEAYREEKFKFSQLSKIYFDPVYGEMRGETPLKELLNEQ